MSPYSGQMRENADQNNSEYGHFPRSENKNKGNVTMETIWNFACVSSYLHDSDIEQYI